MPKGKFRMQFDAAPEKVREWNFLQSLTGITTITTFIENYFYRERLNLLHFGY